MPRWQALLIIVSACAYWPSCKARPDHSQPLTTATTDTPATHVQILPADKGTTTESKSTRRGGKANVQHFDHDGSYGTLTGAVRIYPIESSDLDAPTTAEIAVDAGKLRVYLGEHIKGFVVTPSQREAAGYRYVEATPGNPAKFQGELLPGYSFILEAVEAPAKGVRYRIYR